MAIPKFDELSNPLLEALRNLEAQARMLSWSMKATVWVAIKWRNSCVWSDSEAVRSGALRSQRNATPHIRLPRICSSKRSRPTHRINAGLPILPISRRTKAGCT